MEKEIEITDEDIRNEEMIMMARLCVDCYPVRTGANFIYGGDSLCEEHLIKRMEYNGGENE